jgi:hypothetical protein
MDNFDTDMMELAIKEYCSYLPESERKKLNDELESNLKFYDEFSSRLFNLSYLLAMFTHSEIINPNVANDFIANFTKQGPSDNQYINNMYKFYLKNMSEDLIIQYGEEQGNSIFNSFRSVIEKTFLYSELCKELFENDKQVVKSKI